MQRAGLLRSDTERAGRSRKASKDDIRRLEATRAGAGEGESARRRLKRSSCDVEPQKLEVPETESRTDSIRGTRETLLVTVTSHSHKLGNLSLRVDARRPFSLEDMRVRIYMGELNFYTIRTA